MKLELYFSLLSEKGRSLSTINPGSSEVALPVPSALAAIDILKEYNIAILGGDIISEHQNELVYAYQSWGDEYIYLNWYCNPMNKESTEGYLNRSYNKANQAINEALSISEKLQRACYVVLVI